MNSSLKAALAFAAAPLVVGTMVFVTWLITGWTWWGRVWLWLIGMAIVCIIASGFCLARSFRVRDRTRPAGWLGPTLVVGVMLLNFPVGAAYLYKVVDVITRYTVQVINESGGPLESFVLSGPGLGRVDFGSIAPGQQVLKRLHLTGDGKLLFAARQKDQEVNGVLAASADPLSGGRKVIRFAPGGEWTLD